MSNSNLFLFPSTTTSNLPPKTHQWRFTEPSGDAVDSVGGLRLQRRNNPAYVNGIYGGGAYCKLADLSHFVASASPNLASSAYAEGFSVGWWVYTLPNPAPHYSGMGRWYSDGGNADQWLFLLEFTTYQWQFHIKTDSYEFVSIFDSQTQPDSTWRRLVVTMDWGSRIMSAWIDGQIVGTALFPAGRSFLPYPSEPLSVGAYATSLNNPIQRSDLVTGDLSFWAKALSPNEITADYQEGLAAIQPFTLP